MSGSTTAAPPTPLPPVEAAQRTRLRRLAAALAGPVLISLAVLVTLNAFAFRGLITTEHPDVLPFWLPTWCFLGKSIAAGHIPVWNPHVMGGVPFASDPQSGWLYFPPTLLFAALPCGVALRAFIVLQPILAGLGLYGFLRSEGASRPAATVGGLALALPVSGSLFVVSLPFAGMFAWTALLLAATSRLLRSKTWAGRLAWLAACALAWGQLASAHLSDGLVLGTGAMAVLIASRLVSDVRVGRRSLPQAFTLGGLVVLALPLVNLAILLPRAAYIPQTTLGQGYVQLDALAQRLGSFAPDKVLTAGLATTFPLKLIRSPGVYMGALALGLSFAGFWNRRLRALAVGFGAYAVVCYVLSLDAVVPVVGPSLTGSTWGSFYTHFPARLILGVFIAIPILAALGVDAWRDQVSTRTRVLMLLPAVIVWGVLAVSMGALHRGFVLPAVAAAVGVGVLAAVAVRPALVVLIPVALAVELVANGIGNHRPLFPISDYLRRGPVVTALREHPVGRYLVLAPTRWGKTGYHVLQRRADWGLTATQRSMIDGLEEAQGYNPAQLLRYWTFTRAIDPKPMRYNAAGFIRADPVTLDLLQVGSLIQPEDDPPAVRGETPVAQDGRWVLYELPHPPPRATVLTTWSVVSSSSEALGAVQAPGFDPAHQLVLEEDPHPGVGPSGASGGTASFRWEGLGSARIVVDARSAAVVLVRNTFAKNWRATVDGHPAPVLPADYLLQGIPVPPGRHVVELSYRDPLIGWGLVGSAIALAALLGTAAVATRRRRRGHA